VGKGRDNKQQIIIHSSMDKGKLITIRDRIFLHNIFSAVRRIKFVSERMSYITIKGRSCDNIILNMHAPNENKDDDIKDRFVKN
jgi:hypothetical protein